MSNKRVAIIGAGPGGAIALDTFLDYGFTDVQVFERRALGGGCWINDVEAELPITDVRPPIDEPRVDEPIAVPPDAETATATSPFVTSHRYDGGVPRFTETPLYPQLETNVLPGLMSFRKKPVPVVPTPTSVQRYGDKDTFRPHKVIRDYVLELLGGDRASHITYNTTVEKAEQPDGLGGQWKLTLCQYLPETDEYKWWTEKFDGLYVATGRFNVPRVSHIRGLKEAVEVLPQRVVQHLKYFREEDDYADRRVLVVGASISSADIVHLVSKVAQIPVYMSLRKVVPALRGAFCQPFVEAHDGIDHVEVNADGQSLDVTFDDGSTIEGIDRLLLGTGYKMSYPFLHDYVSKYGGVTRDNVLANMYLTTWWNEDPSLVISGIFTDGVTWRAMEVQAMASAALWSNQPGSRFPSKQECLEWETARRRERPSAVEWHSWYPEYAKILEDIGRVGGGYAKLCARVGLPSCDHSELGEVYDRGLSYKYGYWDTVVEDWLTRFPHLKANYERTCKVISSKVIAKKGFKKPQGESVAGIALEVVDIPHKSAPLADRVAV